LSSVAEYVGDDARHLHVGMTSSDVMDTAFALQLKEASAILIEDVKEMIRVLRKQALKYKDTPMIGRTHGVHAEPITFGIEVRRLARGDAAQSRAGSRPPPTMSRWG
jgi:adenylosuccinate lyase